MDPSGRVALVTGASRGIGAAIARRLAEAGVDVAVGYASDKTAAEEQTTHISGMGQRAVAVGSDVSDPAALEEMISTVEAELGSVDILISNAGIAPQQSLEEITVEDWDRVMDVNLRPASFSPNGSHPGCAGGSGGGWCLSPRSLLSPAESWVPITRPRRPALSASCTHWPVLSHPTGSR